MVKTQTVAPGSFTHRSVIRSCLVESHQLQIRNADTKPQQLTTVVKEESKKAEMKRSREKLQDGYEGVRKSPVPLTFG